MTFTLFLSLLIIALAGHPFAAFCLVLLAWVEAS